MAIELQNRSSGILLHITALPSPYGIGDFGSAAYEFVDKLTSANQSLWQILPLGMADKYGCPYSCLSAFGGNTLLISPEKLVEEELLHQSDLNDLYNPIIEKVDFNEVKVLKNKVFKKVPKVCLFHQVKIILKLIIEFLNPHNY